MISERDISEKFSAIWKQNFPLMTPNFIRVFNDGQVNPINKNPIPHKENIRYDIVAEISFNLSEIATIEEITIGQILKDSKRFEIIVSETAKSIWTSRNFKVEDLILDTSEIKDIKKVSENILEFIRLTKKKKVEFKPKLIGYGFIPDLTADLSIDDTLYEIKTVNRNFKSSDLKQLFIYLALKQVSGDKNWNNAGLYNPRRGTFSKFNIKNLVYNLTGGQTPNEAFENLLDGLVRDLEIDSVF